MSNDLLGALPPYSRRIDIPKEMLPSETRLVPGRRYLDLTLPEFTDLAPIDRLLKEIFGTR
jgi:hypothetical protein